MPIQIPRLPQDFWQTALNVFAWAWRIPIACLVIFVCGCFGFLGYYFILRLTAWIYQTWLAKPW